MRNVLDTLEGYVMKLKKAEVKEGGQAFDLLKEWFNGKKAGYDQEFDKTSSMLEYAFDFMESAFGGGQELVIFITELNTGYPAMHFLQQYFCDRYHRYNKELLCHETAKELLDRIRDL